MSFVRNNNRHIAYKEYEPPTKRIISEGDTLIKNLAEKQQNTTINLQEYLQKEPSFEKLAEQISLTSCCSGILSTEQFKAAVKQLEKIEDLKACNLSNEDVKLVLDYRDGRIHKYRNIEPHILQAKIGNILESIEVFKKNYKDKSDTKTEISRKENEALAIKPDSTETRLLKFAMQNKSTDREKFSHPMDNIKLIEANLISRLSEETLTASKIQKQIRRRANKVGNIASNVNPITVGDSKMKNGNIHCFVNESKWDVQDGNNITSGITAKVYTCTQQNVYTIKGGKIVKLTEDEIPMKINIQAENKLTIEEIKAIPKFQNYDIGSPSRVLYLKNLPKRIKESDLNELFSKFSSHSTLLFRIMSGKMRGQAFIIFPDVDMAAAALYLMNGVLLDGKPVIIEFGKNNRESNMGQEMA